MMRFRSAVMLLACLACLVKGEALLAQVPDATPRTWLDDAELREIHFANANEGWAVGDRGVVWHTADGGRDWKRQNVPTSCRLDGVSFVNARHGWAVGGEPYSHAPGSRGVMLITEDGGQNWRQGDATLLSTMRGVRAFTTQHALAWGDRSAIFPMSLYWTADGGRSWSPFSGAAADDFVDAAFCGPQLGAAITRRGKVQLIDDRRVIPAKHPDAGLRGLQRVRFADAQRGVVVGDGGLVWFTQDGGASWRLPEATFPQVLAQGVDFRALAVRGAKIWIAGSPGSVVFHSPDFGRTWETLPTGRNVPFNGLTFVDDANGWAVGAFGAIFATTDGGRSWARQRSGGERVAVMGMFADAETTPWEIFAFAGGQENSLAHAYCLTRRDWLEPLAEDREASPRLQAAMSAVGGSAGERSWRFPVRQHETSLSAERMVALWDEVNDGRALESLEFELVKQLRTWRPSVVFTQAAPAQGDDPLAYVINQAVLKAGQHAGEADYRADEFAQLRLAPWKVNKIYGRLADSEAGGEALAPTQLAPELGRSLGQQASLARAIVGESSATSSSPLGFQLLASALPESASGRGFLGGISLPPGGGAKRIAVASQDRSADQLKLLAVRQRNLQAILARVDDEREADIVLGQLPEMVASMSADSAAMTVFELARRYHQHGRIDLAAQTYGLLVERYPDHALAAPALVWLIQYWSSGEIDWRGKSRQQLAQHAESRSGQVVDKHGEVELTAFAPNDASLPAQNLGATADPQARQVARASRVQALERLLARTRPTLAAEPVVFFPINALRRSAPENQSARGTRNFLQGRAEDAWRACAAAELWRDEERTEASPKPLWNCRRVKQRPKLDGMLDDEVWQDLETLELIGLDEDADAWPTTLVTARDDQFLYIAIAAAKSADCDYDNDAGPRQRDEDLTKRDHVEIFLDIDRDYVTAWQLAVDYRGRVHDSCWGDAAWNPKWYVAASQDDDAWYVEAAIPWDQLASQAPLPADAWAATIRRIGPGTGEQGWAAPALREASLENGGWLRFE
jgi:photosystem II stability/assembly factor-like uncharacterized protein